MYQNLMDGCGYFWRGVGALRNPGLRRYILLPLALNMSIMVAATIWIFGKIDGVVGFFIDWLPSWIEWLYWLILPIIILFLLISSAYMFSTLLTIIASPLNGLLAAKVERRMGNELADEGFVSMLQRTVVREFVKIRYYLPRIIGLVLLSFVPFIQFGVPFLFLLFGAWMAALQYTDYSYDNHMRPFKNVRTGVKQQRSLSLGFGLTVAVLMTVPVLNWFVMPAAVIGATMMRVERLSLDGPGSISEREVFGTAADTELPRPEQRALRRDS